MGKLNMHELAFGITSNNGAFGAARNPYDPARIPGGSSGGSGAAVGARMAPVAMGTDTGGSVRIPASFCGLYGLRPTHGRIPVAGMLDQAPSYDTIGWFARNAATFARVGSVIFGSEIMPGNPGKLTIAEDAFAAADVNVAEALRPVADRIAASIGNSTVVTLAPDGLAPWAAQQNILQSREAWHTLSDWIDQVNPRFSYWVSERYFYASTITDEQAQKEAAVRDAARARVDEVLGDGGFLCLPTSPIPAPPRGQPTSQRREVQGRILQLTCMGGTTGRPQITIPVAEVEGLPVGLSFMGAWGSDEALIGFALELEQTLAGEA
jgi:amidase